MNIEDYKFDDVVDVVNCLNNELMQRTFANNLVDVSNSVYEKGNKKVTGVLLEQRKGKFLNFDIDVIIKAIIITLHSKVTDKNKRAKIELFFNANTKSRFKNLRFVLDYFSLIDLCANTDKTYLYSSALVENERDKTHFLINAVGISKDKMTELIMNREIMNLLNEVATINDSKITILAYGGKVKAVAAEKNISLLKIIEIHELVMKI